MLRKIRRRYEELSAAVPALLPQVGSALRACLKEGYGAKELRADALAGVTVGIVALPLSMALAIACDVAPQYGLYTAVIAGLVAALLGGSRFQVSGPTAAFVVVLVPIVHQFGLRGLLLATALAGLIQVVLALVHAGRLILFIPAPVTTGFTAGIAVVIATLQLKDFLGLKTGPLPEQYLGKVATLFHALPTVNVAELGIGTLTLAILLLWPRVNPRIPSPLIALTASAVVGIGVRALWPGIELHTLGTTFTYVLHGVAHGGIPQLPPLPQLPWLLPGLDDKPVQLWDLLGKLVPAGFAIAMLGAIESLLSATVADGMTGKHHDPDAELLAQGTANLVAPFFGGFAATGALARTATSIRAGAKSPLAAVIHSLFVLLAMLAFAPLLSYLPMAGFAALLLLVAWNMSDARHFVHILRVAPRSDVLVMLVCFVLTVVFDMVRAVTVGVVLAAILFIRRMAEISGATLLDSAGAGLGGPLPPGVIMYRIAGPLFFGAANKALAALEQVDHQVRCVILDFTAVPAMDVTGLVNLETTLGRLHESDRLVLMTGVQAQPLRTMEKAGIVGDPGVLEFLPDPEAARRRAAQAMGPQSHPPETSYPYE